MKMINKNSGISLLITIVYVSAFMLMMAGLAEATLRAQADIRNHEQSARVRGLVRSVEETAHFWAGFMGLGENTENAANVFSRDLGNVFFNPSGYSEISAANEAEFLKPLFRSAARLGSASCSDLNKDNDPNSRQPCVGFAVLGRAITKVELLGLDYYSVPAPFTGDAEEESKCKFSTSWSADNGCHWNKLALGESVEIPLYYEETDSSENRTMRKLNLSSGGQFILRVRTPTKTANIDCLDRDAAVNEDNSGKHAVGCIDSATGDEDRRIMLYPPVAKINPDYLVPSRDPVLVQWLISDSGVNGTATLLASDALDPRSGEKKRHNLIQYAQDADKNTELSASRINEAAALGGGLEDYIMLKEAYNGKTLLGRKDYQPIKDFLPTVEKPVLRLTLVGQPRRPKDPGIDWYTLKEGDYDNRSLDLPYLEYQLLTSDPVSDMKSTIAGFAQIGDFRRTFVKYLKHRASLGGFAVESF